MGSLDVPSRGLSNFPVLNATVPYWRKQVHHLDAHRTTAELPVCSDIVIIGAGFAGAACAYYLTGNRDSGHSAAATNTERSSISSSSITILEAREACSGATGRNGGNLRPDRYYGLAMAYEQENRERREMRRETTTKIPDFLDGTGGLLETADHIARFEVANAEAVERLVREEGIQCDLRQVTSADVFLDPAQAAKAQQIFDELRAVRTSYLESGSRETQDRGQNESEGREEGAAMFPTLQGVRWFEGDDAVKVSKVQGAVTVSTFPAATLWPYKLVMHLLSLAVSRGVNLQTHTPVTSVSKARDPDGCWTLVTSRGTMKARTIILATNAYTSGILPEFLDVIHPVRATCAHIITRSGTRQDAHPACPPSSAVNGDDVARYPALGSMVQRYAESLHDYQVTLPRGDGYVVGGAWRVFRHTHPEQYRDVVDDSACIPAAEGYFDGFLTRTFVPRGGDGSADTGRKSPAPVEEDDNEDEVVDSVWTGIIGCTADGKPHVGRVPGRERIYICAGFNGHGMPNVLLCAKGIVEMATRGVSFAETGIPAAYETNSARLGEVGEAKKYKPSEEKHP